VSFDHVNVQTVQARLRDVDNIVTLCCDPGLRIWLDNRLLHSCRLPPPSVPPAVSFSTHAAALPRTLTLPCPRPQQQHAPRRGRVLNSNSCSDLVLLAACALRKKPTTEHTVCRSFVHSLVCLVSSALGRGKGQAETLRGKAQGQGQARGQGCFKLPIRLRPSPPASSLPA
jgi:hypothetical protein